MSSGVPRIPRRKPLAEIAEVAEAQLSKVSVHLDQQVLAGVGVEILGSSDSGRVMEWQELSELGDNLFPFGQETLSLLRDDPFDLLATGSPGEVLRIKVSVVSSTSSPLVRKLFHGQT